jgi:4-aminobutyrate aminotransferase-like enzyme
VHWNILAITPPLTITREELDEGLEILDGVLEIADEYYAG